MNLWIRGIASPQPIFIQHVVLQPHYILLISAFGVYPLNPLNLHVDWSNHVKSLQIPVSHIQYQSLLACVGLTAQSSFFLLPKNMSIYMFAGFPLDCTSVSAKTPIFAAEVAIFIPEISPKSTSSVARKHRRLHPAGALAWWCPTGPSGPGCCIGA